MSPRIPRAALLPLAIASLLCAASAKAQLRVQQGAGVTTTDTYTVTDSGVGNITGKGTIAYGAIPRSLEIFRPSGSLDVRFQFSQDDPCRSAPAFNCGLRLVGTGEPGGVLTLTTQGLPVFTVRGMIDIQSPHTLAFGGRYQFVGDYTSAINVDGTLDISQIEGPVLSMGALIDTYDVGSVRLGSRTLAVGGPAPQLENDTPGPPVFDGVIADGGIAGGTGGSLEVHAVQGLAGVNTYTGTTRVTGGSTLFLTGAGDIASSRLVQVEGTLDIAAISGPPDDFGQATTRNSATITNLAGSGTVHLGQKTLVISDAAGEFAGVIESVPTICTSAAFRCGSVEKRGMGSFLLSGTSTFNRMLTVSQGTLSLTGDVASDVDVAAGAVLQGTGRIHGAQLFNAGKLAPGLSIGTLTLDGNYVQAPGAVLSVELAPDGSGNDRLVSNAGSAFLDGLHEVIVTGGGQLTPAAGGRTYTIIEAPGGVYGAFTNTLPALGAYRFETLYNADTVQLAVSYSGFAAAVQPVTPPVVPPSTPGVPVVPVVPPTTVPTGTPNQISTALQLDQVPVTTVPTPQQPIAGFSSGNTDFDHVLTVLSNQQGDALFRSFNSIIAEPYADFLTVLLGQNDAIAGSVLERAQGCAARGRGGMADGYRNDPERQWTATRCTSDQRFSAWVDAIGTDGRVDGGDGLSGYDYRYAGGVVGLDVGIGENAVVGGALGATRPRLDNYALGDARIDGDSYFGSLYASGHAGAWEWSGVLAHTDGSFDARRRIVFGDIDRTATASFDGHGWTGAARLSYRIAGHGFEILPEVGLAYSKVTQQDITETGADSLDLHVDDADADAVVGSIGLRFGGHSQWGGVTWHPQGVLRYEYDFSADDDDAHDIQADFAHVPTPGSIDIVGRNRGQGGLYAGLGTSVALSANTTAYVSGGYRLNDNGREYSADVGLRVGW